MGELFRSTATELAAELAAGRQSSVAITSSFLARIAAVEGRVNAFTEVLQAEALAAAQRADEERRQGHVRGPLHGLPVTIKESIGMAGHASTLGVPSRRNERAPEDAVIVQLLREAGAVLLGRTNVSQLLLFHESRNPVFGQTANPWDTARGPGGSSGGEAAALAAGESVLGVGTDIGGSIRVPAHFAGVAGLKPTLDRWSNLGLYTAIQGQEVVRSQVGPMARNARDLALLFTALDPVAMSAADPRVPPLPWKDPASFDLRSLRVGYYVDDGIVPSSKAVARAVREAASALEACGAKVVPFLPPHLDDAVYGYFAALSADAGETAFAFLGDGAPDPTLKSLRQVAAMPNAVRKTAARVLGLAGERRLARTLEVMGEKSVAELYRITATLRAFRTQLLSAWADAHIDVLLGPVHATPALPHFGSKDFALAGSPSMVWNVVQFPAGVVPVTRVRIDEARRDAPKDGLEKKAAAVDAGSVGLPVGVQVVARPWQDELVLAAMIGIEERLRGREGTPVTPVEVA
jgi:fatty acid amide hydrolase